MHTNVSSRTARITPRCSNNLDGFTIRLEHRLRIKTQRLFC
ncbi:hypothetical protein RSOL_027670 [Rhizoctonia solani AG-3 Rhs1AP]|uniref:Uncharacterized protein n=1 Tax=Rhizoctonia solani AG-3 Rhs1AP TaxID=1086054 RepID=X8IWL3_9AGAM|nr:hypothetical protein RSOL_027670 [Rhizoctonia solani AG-3 Rhs1AP]